MNLRRWAVLLTVCLWKSRNLSAATIDLDDFKRINDRFGHIVGDRILERFCEVMQQCFCSETKQAQIGRFGGDEFLVLLLGISAIQEVEVYFDRFLKCVRSLSNEFQSSVSCSAGIVVLKDPAELIPMIERADQAMYAVKGSGGDAYLIVS